MSLAVLLYLSREKFMLCAIAGLVSTSDVVAKADYRTLKRIKLCN